MGEYKAMKLKKSERVKKIPGERVRTKRFHSENVHSERIYSEKTVKMMQILNRFSLLFHVLLACGVCFAVEWVSRHSFIEACEFVFDRNLVFLYNSMIVFASLLLVYMVKKRAALRITISAFWLFLGIINGCVLAKRVTPFGYTDLKMVGDLFTMQSNYFSVTEAVIVIIGVAVAVAALILFWIRGPKYQGKIHRMAGLVMTAAFMLMIPTVTNAAVNNNILTEYFENLAQGYKDYGFVYSFSASVLDRGMSAPEAYSEESIDAVLAMMQERDGEKEQALIVSAEDSETKAALEKTETVKTASADAAEGAVKTETAEGAAKEETAEGAVKAETADRAADTETADKAAKAVNSDEDTDTDDAAEAVSDASEEVHTSYDQEQNTESDEEIPGEDSGDDEYPNIICILLESFVDLALINFLETDKDPLPNFHSLYENYTSGYLEVPVVGAGTANTEFEILTGMGMQFFGLGEYPYKTILKETNCESIAADLKTLGYGAHAVHNNGGNFYSRAHVFSMMGFDTFTCKEVMDITEYTPIGTWPIDDILIGEVEKSLDYTPDQPDFVYTITVEGHGDYPKEKVLENPAIGVTANGKEEGMQYAWEYYVNQIHEVDDFIGDLIEMLEQRDEKTFVVMFGDHLPTMGLTEEEMTTGSLFQTQYVTWNNFGLEKDDKNMTAYQLLADMTEDLGISNGTMFTYHQQRDTYASEEEYQTGMELLQYDILYGEHYVYGGGDPYPASDIVIGTQDVVIERIKEIGDFYYVSGHNFTKWSKVYIDGERISTSYLSSTTIRFKKSKMETGFHRIVVQQMGSSDTCFRSSNEIKYMKAPEKEAGES